MDQVEVYVKKRRLSRFLADNMASATAYEHPRLDDLTTTILRDLVSFTWTLKRH